MKIKDVNNLVPIDRESMKLTEDYLKTRSGLRDLLRMYPSSTPVLDAVQDYKFSEWRSSNF